MYHIEKGVPVPERGRSGGRGARGPVMSAMMDMDVGDSALMPGVRKTLITSKASKLKPRKFVQRKEQGGVRVWRTE